MTTREILSEDEIDALLNLDIGQMPKPEQALLDGVPLNFYDFISEYHKSIIKSRGFKSKSLSFASEFKEKLHSLLRKKILIEPLESEVTTFKDFLKHLQDRPHINIIKLASANKLMLTVLDSPFHNLCIETLFGGTHSNVTLENKHHGYVDNKVSELISETICHALEHVWQHIIEFECELLKTNKDSILSKLANNDEKIILLHYRVKLEDVVAHFDIALPHSLINSVSDKLSLDETVTNNEESQQQWLSTLSQNIYNSKISLGVEITQTQIKLKDVINLQVGDVISIDNPNIGYVLADGKKLFKVQCCSRDSTKVVEILEAVND